MCKLLWAISAPLVAALSLTSCASNSGVVPLGPDSYMVSRQAATGFSGLGSLKADAIQEAQRFCAEKGKVIQVISATESQPPFLLGNYPRAEVQFKCVEPPPVTARGGY